MKRPLSLALCLILSLMLMLSACGTGKPAQDATLPAPGANASAGAQTDAGGPVESVEPLNPVKAGPVYDSNGVVVSVTKIEELGSYYFINYEMKNNAPAVRTCTLDNITVNGLVVPSFGGVRQLQPGETAEGEISVDKGALEFAGISKVGSILASLRIEDEQFEPIAAYESVALYSADESLVCSLKPAEDLLYDKDGVKMNIQGTFPDDEGNLTMFFLVQNDSDRPVRFIPSDYGTEQVTSSEGKRILTTDSVALLPGGRALCSLNVLDADTYYPASFDTASIESVVWDDGWFEERIPIRLAMEGGNVSVTAGEPFYPDYVLYYMNLDQEQSTQKPADEKILSPEVEMTGVYTRTVGIYNDALVTAMVYNPNAETYIGSVVFDVTVYGSDGSVLSSVQKEADNHRIVIRPGEIVPFIILTDRFEKGLTAERAEVTVADFTPLGQKEAESSGTILSTNDLLLLDEEIAEGIDWPPSAEHPFDEDAKLTGTLVNLGQTVDYGILVCVLFDADGNIIVSDTFTVQDVAGGSENAFSEYFRTAIMELPGYDHAGFFAFARQ